jgi:3-oxoacyl-[acyl-carrier protein] reductase
MAGSGKVAVVTGGGTGVGKATCIALAKQGYSLTINYSRSSTEAEETLQSIQTLGVRGIAVQADVQDDQACRKMIEQTVTEFGRVDVLINNAATTEFIPFQDLESVSDEVWLRLYHVNVVGAFHCARAVRTPMLAVGGGQIVNVSSTAAQLAQGSCIPYCCTKAALDNLTVSLARTLAPDIRVNAVAPGFIASRWTERGLGSKFDSIQSAYRNQLPLGEVCYPHDVADAILSLLHGSQRMTGQTLTIDSGMTIAGFQVTFD